MANAIMENIKNPNKTNNILKCKCGSSRIGAEIFKDDDDEWSWLKLTCKKCGECLYYNGA